MPECEAKPSAAAKLHGGPIRIRPAQNLVRFLSVALCLAGSSGLVHSQTLHASNFPLLRSNDVIAFVGGEDVMAMQQFGYVEVMLAQETAAKNLRFRNLGW